MNVKQILITPEVAEYMLTHNKINRPLNKVVVSKYANDMVKGNWKLTHQGIAFDNDGNLIDGQHRLNAIRKANVPINMFVFYECDNFDMLDRGKSRNPFDVISLAGLPYANQKTISLATYILKDVYFKNSSDYDVLDFMKKYPLEFEMLNSSMNTTGLRGISISSVWAAMFTVVINASIYEYELKHFYDVLISGYSNEDYDRIVIILRNRLLDNAKKGKTNRTFRMEAYLLTQSALRLYLGAIRNKTFPQRLPLPEKPIYEIQID
jgi:hypothetical protein